MLNLNGYWHKLISVDKAGGLGTFSWRSGDGSEMIFVSQSRCWLFIVCPRELVLSYSYHPQTQEPELHWILVVWTGLYTIYDSSPSNITLSGAIQVINRRLSNSWMHTEPERWFYFVWLQAYNQWHTFALCFVMFKVRALCASRAMMDLYSALQYMTVWLYLQRVWKGTIKDREMWDCSHFQW